MKKILLLLFSLFFIFPKPIYANGAGLPAFFKINQEFAVSNPLQTFGITASTFLLPQDLAPKNYIVNENINFEVDTTQLETVIPADILKMTTFDWEFGDGSKAVGLKNSHAYKKMGSYIMILTINVFSKDSPTPTKFIDSFLVNVIPTKDFNDLPKAIIKIDGKKVENPLKDTLEFDQNREVKFDASESTEGSEGIIEYLWNFGDGLTSTNKIDSHKYISGDFQTVVLRVKDKNGFISDAFVGLVSGERVATSNPRIRLPLVVTIVVSVLIIGAFATVFLKRKLS